MNHTFSLRKEIFSHVKKTMQVAQVGVPSYLLIYLRKLTDSKAEGFQHVHFPGLYCNAVAKEGTKISCQLLSMPGPYWGWQARVSHYRGVRQIGNRKQEMTRKGSYCLVILLQICPFSKAGLHERRLLNDLFMNYDTRERPVRNESESVQMQLGVK